MSTNDSRRLLWTVSGVVEAPVDDVADVLLRARAGEVDPDSWLLPHASADHGLVLTGGPVRFGVLPRAMSVPTMFIEVDPARRTLAVEGRWWFRGVYSLELHPAGTFVVYRVYDIARTARWLVRLLLLQQRLSGTFDSGRVEWHLRSLLGRIGQRLACSVRIATAAEREGR